MKRYDITAYYEEHYSAALDIDESLKGEWVKYSDVELVIAIKNGFEAKVEALENGEAYKALEVEIEYIREKYRGLEKEGYRNEKKLSS